MDLDLVCKLFDLYFSASIVCCVILLCGLWPFDLIIIEKKKNILKNSPITRVVSNLQDYMHK